MSVADFGDPRENRNRHSDRHGDVTEIERAKNAAEIFEKNPPVKLRNSKFKSIDRRR